MGLFRRFTDILSANLNDLVDRFENPEKMLRQAIREMEQAVATALQGAAKVLASEKLIERQLADNRRLTEDWRERARSAVAASDEALARKALHRRAEIVRLTAALEDQHASTAQAGLKLRRQVDGMKARLAEAKRKLATLSARKQAADAERTVAMMGNSGGAETAFSRFDRLSDRVERDESEAQAWEELCGVDELDEDFAGERQLEIDHELAMLRAEVSRVATEANA